MRHRYDHWVEGLNGDWLISRQRFFGVPIPLWYPVDADGEPDHDHPIVPAEDTLPIDPSAEAPPGLHRRPARPARRLRRRRRHHGHLGDVVADAADRRALGRRSRPVRAGVPDGHAPAGPGDHPHVAVLDGRARPTTSTARCRGPTPRSTAGSSTPTARRCRSRRATSSRRCRCSSSTAPTPCATGRSSARPGVDTAFSEDQMKVGRRLATKLLNVTKFVLGIVGATPPTPPARRRHRSRRPGDARPPRRRRRRGDGRVRRVRLRPGARAHRGVLLVVLRRLRRARQGPGLRRPRATSPAASAHGRAAVARSTTLQRLLAPTLPFAAEEAWSWWHDGSIHAAPWPAPRGATGAGARPRRRQRGARPRSGGPRRRPRLSQRAAVARLAVHAPGRRPRRASRPPRPTCVDALTVAELELTEGELAVDVELG